MRRNSTQEHNDLSKSTNKHKEISERAANLEPQKNAHKKVAGRILSKLLEMMIPRIQKALVFQDLKAHAEETRDRLEKMAREKQQIKKTAAMLMTKSLDLIFKFKRKINLSSALHDLVYFSVQSHRRGVSNQFVSAQKRQSYEFFAKALGNILRSSNQRSMAGAFNTLKIFNQKKFFNGSVNTMKLKSIVEKWSFRNLSYAFR